MTSDNIFSRLFVTMSIILQSKKMCIHGIYPEKTRFYVQSGKDAFASEMQSGVVFCRPLIVRLVKAINNFRS